MATAGQSQLLDIKQIQAVPLDTHLSCALERVPGFHFYWELPKARFTMLTPLSPTVGPGDDPSGGRSDPVHVYPAYSHCFSSCSLPCLHLLVDSIKKQCFYAIHLLRAICRQF